MLSPKYIVVMFLYDKYVFFLLLDFELKKRKNNRYILNEISYLYEY